MNYLPDCADQIYEEKYLTEEDLQYLQSVVVVNCGGTINMAGTSERKPAGAVRSQIDQLKRELWSFGIHISFVDVFDRPPDSSNMGEDEWEIMFQRVREIIERKKQLEARRKAAGQERVALGGIVITHGTDTLQISSFVLSLKFSLEDTLVPVIFTGSYAPGGHPDGSDALTNLRNSLMVAKERLESHFNNLPSGVYVLIGQDIHLASRIAKVFSRPNSEGKYFISFPAPVGKVFINKKQFQIKVNQQYLRRIKGAEPLKLENIAETLRWGIVEHLVVDYFTSPAVLDDFKRRVTGVYRTDRRIGLVIQGDFSRNADFLQLHRILREISDLDVVTMIGSSHSYLALQKAGKIPQLGKIHKSLTHGRARVKLSWLLKFNLPGADVVKLMNTNIVGDIFEAKELPHWIMYETLPDLLAGVEIIMVYPNIQHMVIEDAIARIERSGERGKLYLVGFGDGHIPAPNRSIAQMAEDFLQKERLSQTESLTCCENVAGLLHNLANLLCSLPQGAVQQYLLSHYLVNEGELRSALFRELAKDQNQVLRDSLAQTLENVIDDFAHKIGENCLVKNPELLVTLMTKHAKFSYTENLFTEIIDAGIAQYGSLLGFVIARYPQLIAQRLTKDALLASHTLLHRVGTAIDRGILVEIKTSVARAKTNTDLYEIGNMLKIIGVNSDEVEGWNTLYLIPKVE